MLAGGEVVVEHGKFEEGDAPIVPSRRVVVGGDAKKGDKKGAVSWEWAPFTHSARQDGLQLAHWQKRGVELAEYPYARFDVRLEKITYTDEEYARLLKDGSWTKSDTDHLVDLCQRLDLRWPVILDRFAPVPRRPLEQLQARYYFVAHALGRDRYARSRGSSRLESEGGIPRYVDSSANLGINDRTRDFDASYEEKRRRQLHVAFCRSRAEEAEERALRDELKVVELESRRLKKAARGQASADAKTSAPAGPPDRNGPAPVGVHASGVNPKRPVPGQPFLQSARLRVPEGSSGLSKGMITKLALILEELGVPPRPTPTKLVCDAYDALRRDIVSLLSLQKLATQKEAELKALRVAYEEQRAHASRAHASSGRKDHPAQHGQGTQKRKMPPPTPSHAGQQQAQKRSRK